MRKCILLILGIFLLTGCSLYNIDDLSNDDLIDKILKDDKNKTNLALQGYKVYIPKNMTGIRDLNNNKTLYSENDKYYLYVDLISYYNKNEDIYKNKTNNATIYSKELLYNNKKGYVNVSKLETNDEFFLEIVYNYSKIEVITNDIKKALANSLLILNSIEYNDKIIESLIGNNKLTYDEERFNLSGPVHKDNFLQYEEEYGNFEDVDNELPDEDKINIKNKE